MAETPIEMDSCPERAKVRLRVALRSAAEGRRLLDLAGPGGARSEGQMTSLWIGPDQWLLVSDHMSSVEITERCERAMSGVLHHAVDASAALACVSLHDRNSLTLLAMATAVDWAEESTQPQKCQHTRFARIPAVVHAVGTNRFDIYYDRTYQHYLRQWFLHAVRDPAFENKACPSMY
jgi:heterotetrameric sarcosine oxidase gamma subunit